MEISRDKSNRNKKINYSASGLNDKNPLLTDFVPLMQMMKWNPFEPRDRVCFAIRKGIFFYQFWTERSLNPAIIFSDEQSQATTIIALFLSSQQFPLPAWLKFGFKQQKDHLVNIGQNKQSLGGVFSPSYYHDHPLFGISRPSGCSWQIIIPKNKIKKWN